MATVKFNTFKQRVAAGMSLLKYATKGIKVEVDIEQGGDTGSDVWVFVLAKGETQAFASFSSRDYVDNQAEYDKIINVINSLKS